MLVDAKIDVLEGVHSAVTVDVFDADADASRQVVTHVARPSLSFDDTVGHVSEAGGVSDDDDRRLMLLAQAAQGLQDALLVDGIQFAGRFVGENQPRLPRRRGSDRDPLLLTARERRRAMATTVGQAEGGERGHRPARKATPACEP